MNTPPPTCPSACCPIDFDFSLFPQIMFFFRISLRVLCSCFIYSDEVFRAAYHSVPWYAWMWMIIKLYSMDIVCDLLCYGVSFLLPSRATNCCSVDFAIFPLFTFPVLIAFLCCIHFIESTMWFPTSEIGMGWLCGCQGIIWESVRKRVHTQLIREHSVTVISANWATVNRSWPKEGN